MKVEKQCGLQCHKQGSEETLYRLCMGKQQESSIGSQAEKKRGNYLLIRVTVAFKN